MSSSINRFNIRVYYLLCDEEHRLLVSDELIAGNPYTKLPGGGLGYGESTVECAMREAREELGQEIEVIEHFYTTDFFIQSEFNPLDQIISIYYTARLKGPQRFNTSEKRFDFLQHEHNEESFRWVEKKDMDEIFFSFPADKVVIKKWRAKTS